MLASTTLDLIRSHAILMVAMEDIAMDITIMVGMAMFTVEDTTIMVGMVTTIMATTTTMETGMAMEGTMEWEKQRRQWQQPSEWPGTKGLESHPVLQVQEHGTLCHRLPRVEAHREWSCQAQSFHQGACEPCQCGGGL